MFRLSWHVLLCATTVATLGSAARMSAKPPDLPVKTDNTLTPDILPDSEWDDTKPPQQTAGRPQEPMHCPWFGQHQRDDGWDAYLRFAPSVLENLQKLVRAQESCERGWRSEDGQSDLEIHLVWPDSTSPLCGPGVSVMVDGLTKGCYLSLAVGRWGHAVDLARQAYALDPERVDADPVLSKLRGLLGMHPSCCEEKKYPGDCCEKCPDCPDCPCCPKPKLITLKPLKLIILGRPTIQPNPPAVDPQTIEALDRVLQGVEGEEQEVPVYQKAIAKPYRETNDAPPAIGKGA
jgi:hypothetical protein